MVKELSEKDFQKEVLESKEPVVADFWAEWCVAPDSSIYLSPTNSVEASEIKKTDFVVGFNDGLSRDEIIHSKTSNKEGHCKKVITSTGRNIETTDDHAFLTDRGWIEAQQLTENDRVAILPVIDPLRFEGEEGILIDESDFSFLKEKYQNLVKYVEQLKEKKLIPLRRNDSRLLILSRIAGALFSDGNLYHSNKNNYREISFCLGQKKDVEDVVSDLKSLGFDKVHISEKTSNNNINGRIFVSHNYRVKCLATSLYLLLRTLGVQEGDKTSHTFSVPKWIMRGEKAIKKEFLSGYLGGDGPRVTVTMQKRERKESYNKIGINDLEFHKDLNLVENGVNFANQLVQLLSELGIRNAKVFHEIDPYVRKDGTNSAIIHIKISNNVWNAFVLTQRIGYSYCLQKQHIGMHSGEFCRELLNKRISWRMLFERARALKDMGHTHLSVAKNLGMTTLLAYQWLVKNVKPSIKKHHLKFDSWLENSTKGLKDGFVWENIDQIYDVFLPQVQVITTKTFHNFVANGFLVHNCGPCRMLGPVFEKASHEFKDKVKFVKINVDESNDLAQKYDVMSIPCVIFFKGGKEVDRFVGAVGEQTVKKKIKDAFGV